MHPVKWERLATRRQQFDPAVIQGVADRWSGVSEFSIRRYLIFRDYVDACRNLGPEQFGAVLVDGRARFFCAIRALEVLAERGGGISPRFLQTGSQGLRRRSAVL